MVTATGTGTTSTFGIFSPDTATSTDCYSTTTQTVADQQRNAAKMVENDPEIRAVADQYYGGQYL
jgi:hypothetical protein